MRLELEGNDDVVVVDGDTRIRVGEASLNSYGYGGSMDLDTWGEAELFVSGKKLVVVVASIFWDQEGFTCHWVRWVSEDRGRSWVHVKETEDLEDSPSSSFVTTNASGKRNRMVARNWIERIWSTIRESAPFLPMEPIGAQAAIERVKKRINKIPEEKQPLVMRKLRKVMELEQIP